LLERGLQTNLDLQYGALLKPTIETTIQKQLQGISNRIASLLVRNAFDTHQTRALVTNILGKQPGMKEETLKTILSMTKNAAKANLTRRNPEFADLIASVKRFLDSEEQESRSAGQEPSNEGQGV
jgi:hypothetical protein